MMLIIATLTAVANLYAQRPAPNKFDAERAITTIFDAISHADTAVLGPLLGEDLHWIGASSGTVANKAQLLAAAAGGVIPVATNEYVVDSVQTWEHGDVAVTEYRVRNTRRFHEYRTTLVSRATDVFALRGDRWVLIWHTATWIVHSPTFIVDIDSAQAVAFVGHYEKSGGFVDDVHFQSGHLVAQSNIEKLIGAPGAVLRRVSQDTFSPDGIAPMIVFERDATGHVVGYVQQAPDGTIERARRVVQ